MDLGNVRVGSLTDIETPSPDVRFASNSRPQNWLGLRSALQLRQLGDTAGNLPRLTFAE